MDSYIDCNLNLNYNDNLVLNCIEDIVFRLIYRKNEIKKKNLQIKKNFKSIEYYISQINKNKIQLSYKIDENNLLQRIYFKKNSGENTLEESIEEYLKKYFEINQKINKKLEKLYEKELYLTYQEYFLNNIIETKNYSERKVFEYKFKHHLFLNQNEKNYLKGVNKVNRFNYIKLNNNKKIYKNGFLNDESKKDKSNVLNENETDQLMDEYKNVINKNNKSYKITLINSLTENKFIINNKKSFKKENTNPELYIQSKKEINYQIKYNIKANNQFLEARENFKKYLLEKNNKKKKHKLNNRKNLSSVHLKKKSFFLNKENDNVKQSFSSKNLNSNKISFSGYNISSENEKHHIPNETNKKHNLFL